MVYTERMNKHQFRPELTTHEEQITALMQKVNQVYDLTETEIVRLAVERFWKSAYPNQPIPEHFKLIRFVHLDF
jgi:hypothetical protein